MPLISDVIGGCVGDDLKPTIGADGDVTAVCEEDGVVEAGDGRAGERAGGRGGGGSGGGGGIARAHTRRTQSQSHTRTLETRSARTPWLK